MRVFFGNRGGARFKAVFFLSRKRFDYNLCSLKGFKTMKDQL